MDCLAFFVTIAFVLCARPISSELQLSPRLAVHMVGDTARLRCSNVTMRVLSWSRQSTNSSARSSIYTSDAGLTTSYQLTGRYSVVKNVTVGISELVIQSISYEDAGRYFCGWKDDSPAAAVAAEMVVLDSNPECLSNINLSDVLMANDCGLEPDHIELNCGVGYRGNVPPTLEWRHSSTHDVINPDSLNYQVLLNNSKVVHRLTVNPTWSLNNTNFVCSVKDLMLVGGKRSCATSNISLTYFYISPQVQRSIQASSMDQGLSTTCSANSSQPCEYRWRGTQASTEHQIEIPGQTIPLFHQNFRDLRCLAECRIRGQTCSAEPLVLKFNEGEQQHAGRGKFSSLSENPINPVFLAGFIIAVVVITIIVFVFIFRRSNPCASEYGMQRHRSKSGNAEEKEMLLLNKEFDIQDVGRFRINEGQYGVGGVTCLENKLYVVCGRSQRVQAFTKKEPFQELKNDAIEIREMKDPRDLTASKENKCMFISDQDSHCLWKIQLPEKEVGWFTADGRPVGLSITHWNGLLVLVMRDDRHYIDIYRPSDVERTGSFQLPVEIKEAFHAVQSLKRNFIISYENDVYKHLIGELSSDGKSFTRTFDLLTSKPMNLETLESWKPVHMSIDEDGFVFVADPGDSDMVFALNPQLTDPRVLLNSGQHMIKYPSRLYYSEGELFVGQGWPPLGQSGPTAAVAVFRTCRDKD